MFVTFYLSFLEWCDFRAVFNWIQVSYPTSTTSKHYLCVIGSFSVTLATWLKASIALSLCTSVCWDRGQGSGGVVGGLNNSLWTEVRPRRPPLSSPLTLHMRLLSQCQCQCKWCVYMFASSELLVFLMFRILTVPVQVKVVKSVQCVTINFVF